MDTRRLGVRVPAACCTLSACRLFTIFFVGRRLASLACPTLSDCAPLGLVFTPKNKKSALAAFLEILNITLSTFHARSASETPRPSAAKTFLGSKAIYRGSRQASENEIKPTVLVVIESLFLILKLKIKKKTEAEFFPF